MASNAMTAFFGLGCTEQLPLILHKKLQQEKRQIILVHKHHSYRQETSEGCIAVLPYHGEVWLASAIHREHVTLAESYGR